MSGTLLILRISFIIPDTCLDCLVDDRIIVSEEVQRAAQALPQDGVLGNGVRKDGPDEGNKQTGSHSRQAIRSEDIYRVERLAVRGRGSLTDLAYFKLIANDQSCSYDTVDIVSFRSESGVILPWRIADVRKAFSTLDRCR